MQSETGIDAHVKINTSIAGNVTKYINLHMQESFDKKILTLSNFALKNFGAASQLGRLKQNSC